MAAAQKTTTPIAFTAQLYDINDRTILRLTKEASAQLPSRGQVMVEGTCNGIRFATPLEPDGNWGHWFQPDPPLLKAANASSGDTVTVEIVPTKNWPEPKLPPEWQAALDADPEAYAVWQQATPMAHWEWVRWARGTNNIETYHKRIAVGCSKLRSGERRPCCWNRNLCSEPAVSKNGVLLEPTAANA